LRKRKQSATATEMRLLFYYALWACQSAVVARHTFREPCLWSSERYTADPRN